MLDAARTTSEPSRSGDTLPMVTLTLPILPLPLSRYFINVGQYGRADSYDYTQWKQAADAHLAKFHSHALGYPKHPAIKGDVKIRILFKRPDRRKRDLDNLNKAAWDLLSRNHVIEDGSRIIEAHIKWDDSIAHPTVIEVERVSYAQEGRVG